MLKQIISQEKVSAEVGSRFNGRDAIDRFLATQKTKGIVKESRSNIAQAIRRRKFMLGG